MRQVADIDAYIADFPADLQKLLAQMRNTIRKAAPKATETIRYGMPTFAQEGSLVHFAAYKNHIGFYPTSSGVRMFEDELSGYKTSKGAIQFPLDKPLPLALVSRIVKFRVQESLEKAAIKREAKTKGKKAAIKQQATPGKSATTKTKRKAAIKQEAKPKQAAPAKTKRSVK